MSTSTPHIDHHDDPATTSSAYDRGFEDGRTSRDAEFEALERVADYWYARALNPNLPTPEGSIVDSIIAGMEANEARARRHAELDAIEQARFANARVLIANGYDDIEVALKAGLFIGVVANLRAGNL